MRSTPHTATRGAAQIEAACLRLKEAQIAVSVTLISGLGGKELLREHAVESAKLISAIRPEYASILTLMLEPGTPLYEQYRSGNFDVLTAEEVAEEMLLLR